MAQWEAPPPTADSLSEGRVLWLPGWPGEIILLAFYGPAGKGSSGNALQHHV